MRTKTCAAFMAIATISLFLAFAPSILYAQAGEYSLPTHHVREAVVDGQARIVGLLPGTQHIGIAIMLPLRNQEGLNDLLHKLYDRHSPSYRHYLTVQQFTERFGPTQDDYDAVIHFAQANGMTVNSTSPNRLVVDVTTTVANANKAFHVAMGIYQHPTENRTFYAPNREPSVDLRVPLWHIAGLDNYSIPRPTVKRAPMGQTIANITGSGPGGTSYLASDMRAAYYGSGPLTGSGQAVGLVEFDGYYISDVASSFDGHATSSTNGNNYILTYTASGVPYNIPINNVLLDGASSAPITPDPCGGDCEAEVVLDIVQPIGMAPGLSQVRVYIAPYSSEPANGGDGDVLIFNRMAADDIAMQLSCSWTWEPDDPKTDEPIFLEFQTQGQSFFSASGDDGSWSHPAYYYPQEDPDVTAVGGTDLTTNGAGGSWASETAWVYSGGGPSPDGFPIPPYQQIAGVINSSNKGSTTLRNAPDVAAEANNDNYNCASLAGGCTGTWGGTSFAAPRWAGFMALVNQNNAAFGDSPEGFINLFIYPIGVGPTYGSYFHDIASGNNDCCGQSVYYKAVIGYDLVTGWGSPLATGWLTPGLYWWPAVQYLLLK
ncbi:MAG TPA: S53 family peptidase [Candidatus Dormibacteraeota bacterium]|jgi:subtilase family serine protease|nr:S53 family peptidase [Candidatus Dormibacteraeota bacterium]